jgi:hypothetical protein
VTASTRIREHLRSNVVGYVALFCFAMVGTAGALPGRNTVGSGDIKPGAVRDVDLAQGAVTAEKISDSTFAAGDIARSGKSGDYEIPANAIQSGEVSNGTLTGNDVADASLTGAEVASNSLTGADIDEHSLGLGSAYSERTSSLQLTSSRQTVLSRSVSVSAATQLSVVASIRMGPDAVLDGDFSAGCEIEVDGLFRSPVYEDEVDELEFGTFSVTYGRTVFPGSHTVALRCLKFGDPRVFVIGGMTVLAVPLA